MTVIKASVVSYPQRGPYGDPKFKGNTSGFLIKDLIETFKPKTVLDAMAGGFTTADVCHELGVTCECYDLNMGFDLLTSPLPPKKYDMIFFHPPYWNIIRYSANPADLSNCKTFDEYMKKLSKCVERLAEYLTKNGILVMLSGDVRKDGQYYPLGAYVQVLYRQELRSKIIKIQHGCQSNRFNYGNIIRIAHEEVLVLSKFKKITWRQLNQRVFDELNAEQLTLPELYKALEKHPKRTTNSTFKATIRRTVQENGKSIRKGVWKLKK